MAEFVVISGLSGAGRSSMADHLEDLGWFVIDNLPTPLMPKVLDLATAPGASIDKVALVVGAGRYQDGAVPALADLRRSGTQVRLVFLDASTESLVRRYESTKRRHPQGSGDRLGAAIERERALLEPVKAEADLVIDTSDLNVHELKARVMELFGGDTGDHEMQITLLSFGYKHGLPRDVDVVLDCRFLPNPYWVNGLRAHTGLDDPVREYVLTQETTGPFLERLDALLDLLLPAYVGEGKAYLTIAFGCTGGRHRSVVIAEELARRLRGHGYKPSVNHRDIAR